MQEKNVQQPFFGTRQKIYLSILVLVFILLIIAIFAVLFLVQKPFNHLIQSEYLIQISPETEEQKTFLKENPRALESGIQIWNSPKGTDYPGLLTVPEQHFLEIENLLQSKKINFTLLIPGFNRLTEDEKHISVLEQFGYHLEDFRLDFNQTSI